MDERSVGTARLGALVSSWRKDAGLSQSAIAELLGTQQATVSKLESGTYKLTVAQLVCIVNACGLSLRDVAADVEDALKTDAKPIWERIYE